jgi:hypothetical protein
VCSEIANLLNLTEGVDYTRVCMGELGFGPLIDDLAREDWNRLSNNSDALSRYHPRGEHLCDIGVRYGACSSQNEPAFKCGVFEAPSSIYALKCLLS